MKIKIYKFLLYKGENYMKKLCETLQEHKMKIKYWTNEQKNSYQNPKICYICSIKFENKYMRDKKYCKDWDRCGAYSICNLKYTVPKKNYIAFCNGYK